MDNRIHNNVLKQNFLHVTNDQQIASTCHDHERKQNESNGTIVISWKATTWTTKLTMLKILLVASQAMLK
jgi:hypothetical protein